MPEERQEAKDREAGAKPKKAKSAEEKRVEYLDRIERTFIASIAGAMAGVITFIISDHTTGFLIMIIAIILQKYIFYPLRRGLPPLGGKDWFYQSFMTFTLWFIVLTFLLTSAL